MLGYLGGNRMGAMLYNIGHSSLAPLALAALAYQASLQTPLEMAFIWLAHIGFDRMVGYGLKQADAFKHTHLSATNQEEWTSTHSQRSSSHDTPTFILTNEADPVRDDSEAFAEALSGAGVSVVNLRARGLIHAAWPLLKVPSRAEFDGNTCCFCVRFGELKPVEPATGTLHLSRSVKLLTSKLSR